MYICKHIPAHLKMKCDISSQPNIHASLTFLVNYIACLFPRIIKSEYQEKWPITNDVYI